MFPLYVAVLVSAIAPADERFSLPAKGLIPLVETAGPFAERPSWKSLLECRWRLAAVSPGGAGGQASYFHTGKAADLSRIFMPVTGRAYARIRIVPASDGPRSLEILSLAHSTCVSIGGEWQPIPDVMKRPSWALSLTGKRDETITVVIEVTPLYYAARIACMWNGEQGDALVVGDGAEKAVLDGIGVDPELPLVERLAQNKTLRFSLSWPENPLGPRPLTLTGPDDRQMAVEWGVDSIQASLPSAGFQGTAVTWKLKYGGAEREYRVPFKPGLEKEVARLRALADSIPLPSRARRAVFLLRLSQAESDLKHFGPFGCDWNRLLERVEEARAAWEFGEGDYYGTRAGFREDAYVSDVDLSAQPFLLYVSSKPAEKRPLLVYLHGYVPDYKRADWIGPRPMDYLPYEEAGAIYVVPFARSNTDFLTVGETDVMDVIAEMKRRFPIDEDRIYLSGYSMGGCGVWTLMTHYPDVWAGGLVLAGRTDYYFWQNLDREKLSPWLNAMILADNPIDQAENIAHIPVLVFHGDMDWVVKKEHATRMVEKLRAMGAPVEFYWVRGADHWRAGAVLSDESIAKKLLTFRRTKPSNFSRRTWLTKYASWRGIEVLSPDDPLSAITVNADLDAGTVKAENVTLLRAPAGLAAEGFNKVHEADGAVYWARPGADFSAAAGATRARHAASIQSAINPCSSLLCRSPSLPGTFRDLISRPFAVVYGTRGPRAEKLRAAADEFASMWYDFTDCNALVFADSELPHGMERERSLILIGEAPENAWTLRAAAWVPVKVTDGTVKIGNTTHALRADEGYIITYPSPFAADRYVALSGEAVWGRNLPVNHKWDFVPDIAVFRQNKAGFQGGDEYLFGGFFDAAWRLDGKLLFVGHERR